MYKLSSQFDFPTIKIVKSVQQSIIQLSSDANIANSISQTMCGVDQEVLDDNFQRWVIATSSGF